jgi:hypothetical protein
MMPLPRISAMIKRGIRKKENDKAVCAGHQKKKEKRGMDTVKRKKVTGKE